jgi:hypothetical protein
VKMSVITQVFGKHLLCGDSQVPFLDRTGNIQQRPGAVTIPVGEKPQFLSTHPMAVF